MILRIVIPAVELFDEVKEEFFMTKEYRLSLQHSLISLAKWEARWGKPFLDSVERTPAESLDYIKCMTITQNIPDIAYRYIPAEVIHQIRDHMQSTMTATTIAKTKKNTGEKEVVTAEIIYHWMIALNIPMECQKWHLNRLLTLVQVCSIKSKPPEKMSKREALARQRRLNAERKKQLNTRG